MGQGFVCERNTRCRVSRRGDQPQRCGPLVVAVEISDRSWVLGAHVPGSTRPCSRLVIEPDAAQLTAALARLAKRAPIPPTRTVVAYEAGHTGFWLARLLRADGVEAYVHAPGERAGGSSGPPGQDRPAGRRAPAPRRAGLAARRTRRVLDGAGPGRGGRGSPPGGARAPGADDRARPAHQPCRRAAGDAGHHGLRPAPRRPTLAAGCMRSVRTASLSRLARGRSSSG